MCIFCDSSDYSLKHVKSVLEFLPLSELKSLKTKVIGWIKNQSWQEDSLENLEFEDELGFEKIKERKASSYLRQIYLLIIKEISERLGVKLENS